MPLTEKHAHWAVFILSMVCSVGGFFYCVLITKDAPNAGRGAALGVAIALAFLFVNRDYGSRLYRALTRDVPGLLERIRRTREGQKESAAAGSEPTIKDLERRIETLASAIIIDGQGHQTESRFLALATFVGTVVWGFGDLGAKYLIGLLASQ